MPQLALARKYRPQNFAEVVGQEITTKALQYAFEHQHLHHAYLFSGGSGVGKTSLARIIAKCLNCERGISANPCMQCSHCLAIQQGNFADLIEIDAASRTKVEDTREILENVQYGAVCGRYKIFLIDELHMLSTHSFNALLKTLEEPPEHVIFLLATTEAQKIPITILTRCLQFHLRPLSETQIAERLQSILTTENINFESQALILIAEAARGSMRDALSLLDQAILISADKVTAAAVEQMLGCVAKPKLFPLIDAIASQNFSTAQTVIAQFSELGSDFISLTDALLTILHHIAIAQFTTTQSVQPPIANYAKQLTKEQVQLYYQIALIGKKDLLLAPHPRIGFEMMILRIMAFHLAEIPQQDESFPFQAADNKIQPEIVTKQEKEKNLQYFNWEEVLKQLSLTPKTKSLAVYGVMHYDKNAAKMVFQLHQSQALLFGEPERQELIAAIRSFMDNNNLVVEIEVTGENIASPQEIAKQRKNQKKQEAITALDNDQRFKQMLQAFNAKPDFDTIQNIDDESE